MIAKITGLLNVFKNLGAFNLVAAVLLIIFTQAVAHQVSTVAAGRSSSSVTKLLTAVRIPISQSPAPASAGTTTAAPTVILATSSQQHCVPQTVPNLPAINTYKLAGGVRNIVEPNQYYQVYGQTKEQIAAQLAECGPLINGQRWAGNTTYNISWYFDYAYSEDKTYCSLKDISVASRTRVVLPAWQASSGAVPGLEASWTRAITALAAHENGHVLLAQTAAQTIHDKLQAVSQMSCTEIGKYATSIAQNELAKLRAGNDGYDAATGHGLSQGSAL